MATILVVDDRPANRLFMTTLLDHSGHHFLQASDGVEGLALARSARPDLIITDVVMPSMDGYAFVRYLRVTPGIERTPVIFWTATYLEREAKALASACGVSHVLSKPCESRCIVRAVQEALASGAARDCTPPLPEFDRLHVRLITNKLAQKMGELESTNADLQNALEGTRAANEELALAYDATLEGWVRALDLRDHETEGHTQRVTDLTVRLARSMGLDGAELIPIRRGALLHDIGKLGIPDKVLLKPGPLDEDEWKLMRMHPAYARQMLEPIRFLGSALEIPYCHHERWDGKGYPCALEQAEIPRAARIFAVADVWDALCSSRPYHDAWPERKAREYIGDQSGKHFDPDVVRAFMAGSFVCLASDAVAPLLLLPATRGK
ncbi:MAG TPA: HD domain-containing phosphohydrolase [Gemmataceae bacterium]|nr:HD domain-containing phosphohydrolase [Gemmataceae bacterium]